MESHQENEAIPRGYSRVQLGVPAELETLDGCKKVEIVDLSQGGAHIRLAQEFWIKDCLLRWLRYEVFATVTWRKGLNLGIQFEAPLSPKMIFETRQKAAEIIREEEERSSQIAQKWGYGQ